MIESLAERRLSMINKSGPSPLPGELLALRPGDQVEIYRKTTKDRPYWVGLAEVRDAQIEHGKVAVYTSDSFVPGALQAQPFASDLWPRQCFKGSQWLTV